MREQGRGWEALLRDVPDGRTGALTGDDKLAAEALVVDVEGFEGPLDILLTLARSQKVDLRHVSILQLAEQYLAFVEEAKRLRIELAADYLVMAAWLAYLKSRLLLPPEPTEEGPSAEELAARLAWRLERLEAMREAGARLMGRDQLERDRFARGAPEAATLRRKVIYDASLIDLLRAYSRIKTRDDYRPLHMNRAPVMTPEEAIERMRGLIGDVLDWRTLSSFLPPAWRGDPKRRRSATAATFVAMLELVRRGEAELRQFETFGEITLRRRAEDGR
ncbi:ScpA family protein [Albimonas sp. CAU 1670]|uniref:segregation and condensation protein A n=1 Tax=Albimonas sp. CAU 1670 TaxID=3032599 RepID=UPI0023DAC706|nr:ScpA family protein [Albimonas sp. CAU 1670]MDF2232825.1 ScpA family protein [Albimonas sp. CAU 1670]